MFLRTATLLAGGGDLGAEEGGDLVDRGLVTRGGVGRAPAAVGAVVVGVERHGDSGGDPLEGGVPEDKPDLPAVDEDTLDAENGLLTTDAPDPADYNPETQPEPL